MTLLQMTTFDNCARNNRINKNDKTCNTPTMPNTINANDVYDSNAALLMAMDNKEV